MTTYLTIPRFGQPNPRTLLQTLYAEFPDVPVSWETDPLHKVIHASFSNVAPAILDETARLYLEPVGITYTVSSR